MPDPRHAIVAVDRPREHPAFAAWRRLDPTAADPTRVEILKESWKTGAYRLIGSGPRGIDIVATRRPVATTLVERTIYREILPLSRVPSLRLHGVIDEDDDTTWMFLDDAGEDMVDLRRSADRVAAGTWLGRLHADLAGVAFADRLPDRGADDAIVTLRSTRADLTTAQRDATVDADDRRFIGELVRRLDAVEARWDVCLDLVADLPTTVVHGDFAGKNLRHRLDDGAPSVVPFDWEMSGWGPPLRDLTLIDLGAYIDQARLFWGRRASQLDRLADVGRLFALIAAIGWEAPLPDVGWLSRHQRRLPVFHERLGSVLVRLEMAPVAVRRGAAGGADSTAADQRNGTVAIDLLARGLRSMEPHGPARIVDVIDRVSNVFRSTYPSEIVRCACDDGEERTLFVKRYIPGLHDGDPYWEGGPYEARMYDDVLGLHDFGTPTYFGSWSDSSTGETFLALEYLVGWRLNKSEPPWMLDAARWLARLHRDATATAMRHPAVRVYDEAFFRRRSRRALAAVRSTLPDASWIEPLVQRFDEVMVPRLLVSEPAFIHGEPYPENVIVNAGRIRVVDWQSAAIGAGAIDCTCLTEGPWPADLVKACEDVYVRERWPGAAPASFDDELEAARLYWSMRWLGADADATTSSRHAGYIERLRGSAERLGLLAG